MDNMSDDKDRKAWDNPKAWEDDTDEILDEFLLLDGTGPLIDEYAIADLSAYESSPPSLNGDGSIIMWSTPDVITYSDEVNEEIQALSKLLSEEKKTPKEIEEKIKELIEKILTP